MVSDTHNDLCGIPLKITDIPYGPVGLTPCDGTYKFCCGVDQAARACCDSSNDTMVVVNPVNNPVANNPAEILTTIALATSTAIKTATITSNATSGAQTNTAGDGEQKSDKKMTVRLAAGLGVPLAIALALLAGMATALYRKRHRHPGPVRARENGLSAANNISLRPVGNAQ